MIISQRWFKSIADKVPNLMKQAGVTNQHSKLSDQARELLNWKVRAPRFISCVHYKKWHLIIMNYNFILDHHTFCKILLPSFRTSNVRRTLEGSKSILRDGGGGGVYSYSFVDILPRSITLANLVFHYHFLLYKIITNIYSRTIWELHKVTTYLSQTSS